MRRCAGCFGLAIVLGGSAAVHPADDDVVLRLPVTRRALDAAVPGRLPWLCVLFVLGCPTRPTQRPLSPVATSSPQADPAQDQAPAQRFEPAAARPRQPEPVPTPRLRVAEFVEQHEPLRLHFTAFHWIHGNGVRAEVQTAALNDAPPWGARRAGLA